jgi:hypothetical protein
LHLRASAYLSAAFTSMPIVSSCPEAKKSAFSLFSWITSDVASVSDGLNLAIHNYWGTDRDLIGIYDEQQLQCQPAEPWTPLIDDQENRTVAQISHTILHSGITKSTYVTSTELTTCNNDFPLDGCVIYSYLLLLMKRHPNVFVLSSFRQLDVTDIASGSASNFFDTNEYFAKSINGFDPERHNIVVFPWHDPVGLFHWAAGMLVVEKNDHTLFTLDSLSGFPDMMRQDISHMVCSLRRKFGIDKVPLKIDSTQRSYLQETPLSCGVVTLWNIMWSVAHQAPAPSVSPPALARLRLFIVASILAGGQMCQEVLDMLPAGLFLLPPAGVNQACTSTIERGN